MTTWSWQTITGLIAIGLCIPMIIIQQIFAVEQNNPASSSTIEGAKTKLLTANHQRSFQFEQPPRSIVFQPIIWNATDTFNPSGAVHRREVGWKLNESLACKDITLTKPNVGALRCYYEKRPPTDPTEWSIASYNVNFGVDLLGENARNSPQQAYLKALRSSRIVLTCHPMPWEGDWRLAEAMASGALVITSFMLDPYPGIKNGENVVLYNNTNQMMQLLQWYVQHPKAATRIATAGRELALQWTPQAMMERLLDTVWTLPDPPKVYIFEFPSDLQNAETVIVQEGFNRTSRAVVVDKLSDADIFILDVHRLNHCKQPTHTCKAEAEAALGAVNSTSRTIAVALDFQDRPYSRASTDGRFDFYFKRSRVCRRNHKFWDYGVKVYPLYYPLKSAWKQELALHAAELGQSPLPLLSEPTYDLSLFFPLFHR
eukprot:m.266257 g.266257  ORF g.266257 m.266257 type:complete len:429 (-) comp66165_c0_seq1:141-1427(-)